MAYQANPQVLKYAQDRYLESFNFLQEWKRRKVRQLVLLNNLQRGDQNIASTLLLTLFLRILSSNYDDKNQVKFLPSQGILQEQLNAYNMLAESDYLEMGKAKLDYDATWDTIFFNRSYIETLRFDKKRKIMQPVVINPLVMGYDPYFTEVQDWRYYWKWITKSRVELNRLIKKGVITGISSPDEIMGGMDQYLWNYKALVDRAKLAIEPPPESMGGDIFQILEFYSYDEDGNKCVSWLDKTLSIVLWHEKLQLDDEVYNDEGVESIGSKWPIVTKELFRDPHSSLSFSVADILEDKHRAKSVLLNLAYIAAKDRANPTYLYNPDKVQDVSQFLSRQINQHIPVNEMEGAVMPLNTEEPMSTGLMDFISMLQQEANEPMGTSIAISGDSGSKETATKSAIDQQLNDMAQSIQSKVMQFGESEFWSHWFHRYAKYGPELKSKIANIVGVKGITSRTIDFKDFNTDYPPGVLVYSAKEAEYKELVLRRDLMQLYPNLMQSLDPEGMKNFNKHVFFPKFLQDPSLIDIVFPKSLDEMKADDENDTLKKDEYVEVADTDNHTAHIYIHHMVQPKTWALWFHLAEHEKKLAEQGMQGGGQQGGAQQNGQSDKPSESIGFKDLPPDGQVQMAAQAGIKLDPAALATMQQQQAQAPQMPGQSNKPSKVNIGAEKQNQVEAASPIKTEINPNNSIK